MHIAVGNVYSKVLSCIDEEDAMLRRILCVPVPNHKFMTAFKNGQWDGMKQFYTPVQKTFPTGFLPFIIAQAHGHKYRVETDDQRQVPGLRDPTRLAELYPKLREYQLQALTQMLTHTLQSDNQILPWSRGVLKLVTGGGKTIISASLVDFLGKKTLYVIERKELMYQTRAAFQAFTKMSLGFLGDGNEELGADITFAMAQTLRSKFKQLAPFFKSIGCLVIDEVQHLSQGIYHEISTKCPAPFRYGVSGTPLQRGDLGDVYLIADTGEIIAEGDREEIEAQGYIATPKVYMFDVMEPQCGLARMSFKHAYQVGIVENEYRNEMIVTATRKLRDKGCTILILVRYVEHGRLLQKMLEHANMRATFIQGSDATEARQAALQGIGQAFHILIATAILDEGVDLPVLDALIRAGGGQSHIKTLQQVGRVLRPKPGSNTVTVVDFMDKTQKYLLKHAQERLAAYKEEGFKVFFPVHV